MLPSSVPLTKELKEVNRKFAANKCILVAAVTVRIKVALIPIDIGAN